MSEVKLSTVLGPAFHSLARDVFRHGHTHYDLSGGRGSLKSSCVSLLTPLLLLQNPGTHALVLRKVTNTIRGSVYAQYQWAVNALGMEKYWTYRLQPMELIYRPTGQKIMFRGADDPMKIKSIKVPFGYIAVTHFEEKDQFAGPDEIRTILQSTMRGGPVFWNFESYNPPISRDNWANLDSQKERADRLCHRSTYLEAPPEWLGEQFLREAENLRRTDERAYRHEYLGEATGVGGNVFENLELREITDAEIASFDRIFQGVDWGWFPDPFAFIRLHYDRARETIYFLDELYENKLPNEAAAEKIKAKGYTDAYITCDNAEPKSVADFRACGLPAKKAEKGPGSVDYGMKWLQKRKLVMDKRRTPHAYREFLRYEYERDRNGDFISGYPDADNHLIDATKVRAGKSVPQNGGDRLNILEKLKEKGFDTIPQEFYGQIELWKSWYDGDVRRFHNYRVFNGQNTVHCRRYTLGMGKKVAEDWANLLMNEKVKITLDGAREQEFFDSVCKANNFAVKANEMQELKSALGTAAYVARVSGVNVREDNGAVSGGGVVKLDYVTAPNIFPLSWENGMMKECAFTSSRTVKGEKYLYLQIHRMGGNGNYLIENSLYVDNNGSLSDIDMGTVSGFEAVPPLVETGSPNRLFVIDRLNISNNYDNTLPMGIPAFANAIDQLKGVDIAYDSYVNEFVLGKKRVMVKPGAVKDLDGNPLFDPNELYYYVLPEDTADGNIIQPIDMTLRTAEHNAGLQDMLNVLSSRCGFGENHYRFDNGSIATATQVISENSTMFRTIKKHEIILADVLQELCRIVLRLGNSILHRGLNEDVEITVDFDDSIIEDTRTELQDMRADVAAGLIRGELYVAKKYGVSEEEARRMMPGLEELADKEQEEVE